MGVEIISMRKSFVGWTEVKSDDVEATHKMLSVEDFKALTYSVLHCREEISKAKNDAEMTIRAEKLRLYQESKDEIESMKRMVKELEGELADQKKLNAGLLRINRERGNAEKELEPKKEHSGYSVVLSESRKNQKNSRGDEENRYVWETKILTPYTVDVDVHLVKAQVAYELLDEDDGMIRNLGITVVKADEEDYAIKQILSGYSYEDKNVIYEVRYQADFRGGYWTVVCMHTKPIGKVPDNMRPPKKRKKK